MSVTRVTVYGTYPKEEAEMIVTNAALYIGMVTACILDNCPKAIVHVERTVSTPGTPTVEGYTVTGTVKVGTGASARSFQSGHQFTIGEVANASGEFLVKSARMAGDQLGVILAQAR
jgi:hypothetical protein